MNYDWVDLFVVAYVAVAAFHGVLIMRRVAHFGKDTYAQIEAEGGNTPFLLLLYALYVLFRVVWDAMLWPRYWVEIIREKS